ncbi:hypothetical protein GCM10007276_26210 [Agaricicola taiwanensis]|uniref:DUF883 family protein n=1 Tax=Agaricicola taiwanensis TaxID=591372 RepID=A0A8J2YJC8_9RHOB|nr:hypothetical protein [Agaricicola taiwanensis]GGE47732.1 hypothetical protein GCM10007276_26210 [Agaricicola taiwanensis]
MFGSRRSSNDLSVQIEDLQSQLDDLLRATGKRAKKSTEPIRSTIVSDMREIYDQIDSILSGVGQLFAIFGRSRRKMGDALHMFEDTVEKNPSKAVLAAIGVGLAIYFLAKDR